MRGGTADVRRLTVVWDMRESKSVHVKLTRPVPFRVALSNGRKREIWEVGINFGGKNHSKECLYAECMRGEYRCYLLVDYGRRGRAESAASSGFFVVRGSPMHGLVTAMRRAGVAELS